MSLKGLVAMYILVDLELNAKENCRNCTEWISIWKTDYILNSLLGYVKNNLIISCWVEFFKCTLSI